MAAAMAASDVSEDDVCRRQSTMTMSRHRDGSRLFLTCLPARARAKKNRNAEISLD